MERLFTFLAISILLVSCSTTKNKHDIVLSEQGNTKYHIIVSDKATDNELFAALNLQEYIYKISGAKIPIVNKCRKSHKEEIHIGKTCDKKTKCQKPNTISVKRDGSSLYFNCEDDRFTMYSVIDFMEKYLNVRKFTSSCDYYPIDSNLTLKNFVSYEYTTPNEFRCINSQFVKRNKDVKRWLKLNTIDEIFANGYFVHTILNLCQPQEFYNTNPEYFALVNNSRSREQVCWSNEQVYTIVKNNLEKAMIIQPDKILWSVSQADNDIYCTCDKCKEIIEKHHSPAAPIILFVNRLAKEFPDKTISTLAYRFSRKCPENINIEPNVQIMLCSIEADRNKTIEQQGNAEGSFAYDLKHWGQKTQNIFLWDYECDFAYYLCPFPNLHVLKPNISFFYKNNAFHHFQQANCDTGHEFAELKNYLISQLLWNPDLNVDTIITEFCNNYYGKAGTLIKKYLDDIENEAAIWDYKVNLDIYGSPIGYKDNILSKENLIKWSQLFDNAENIVKDDSVSLLNVKTARLPIDYAVMEIGKTDMYGERGWFEKVDNKWIVKKEMSQKLDDFIATCRQAEVRDINENGFTPEEYYMATKRIIDNDLTNNLAFGKKITANIMPSSNYSDGRLATLTDGVKGSDDYKLLWLGWWGQDIELTLDLEKIVRDKKINISSLAVPKSWILHPLSVECLVSQDGKHFISINKIDAHGNNRNNPIIKDFSFDCKKDFRYIKFVITATKTLPSWHPCYTQPSWVFLDEITVE